MDKTKTIAVVLINIVDKCFTLLKDNQFLATEQVLGVSSKHRVGGRCECRIFWWRKQFLRSRGALIHGRWVPFGQLNNIDESVSTCARLKR